MKKVLGIIVIVAAVAVMVLLLFRNKAEIARSAAEIAEFDSEALVTTIVVSEENINRSFTSNGATQAVSELNFVSDISGRVVKVLVDKGSRVSTGAPLLEIDKELLEAEYQASLAAYEAMKKDEQRFSRSNEAGGVTSQQLDNIRTQLVAAHSRLARSRKMLDDAIVKSPMNGVIDSRFVEPGSLIAPNVPLFNIVDDSRLKVICNVPESRIGLLEKGQKVVLSENLDKNQLFTGQIHHIGIKTDRGLNYPVEVYMDRNRDLRIGMYLKAQFCGDLSTSGILVPRRSVTGSALSASVFVVRDGKAYRIPVVLGEMYGDRVEVVSGLSVSDEVIVSGLMNVADGETVKVINNR